MRPATDIASAIGGFVAAEGAFLQAIVRGAPTFTFVVSVGSTDAAACRWLRSFFGCGTIHTYARRLAHYDDETRFQVRRFTDLVGVVVPFMDEHLPTSHKRQQYLVWRSELTSYWEAGVRRRRACGVRGCESPSRAKGLCRRHYYETYGL